VPKSRGDLAIFEPKHASGLIDYKESKKVYRKSLWEFIEHGLRYVFPAIPRTIVNGMYAAHSHSFMKIKFPGEVNYVWPDGRGKDRGLAFGKISSGSGRSAMRSVTCGTA
jgi:hypothetical protein